MELPTTRILDRALVHAAIEDYRKHAAPALQRVVDEGIAVFERCSVTATGGDENLAVLFPALHVFEMLDGVDILLLEAAVIPSRTVMRAAFEAKLIVEYVTEADSTRRGAASIVCEVHRRLRGLERWDPDSSKGRELRAEFRKDTVARSLTIPAVPDLLERRDGLRRVLRRPHFEDAAKEYYRLRALRRHPAFHAFWGGPGDTQQLARHVGRGAQYEILYRTWSSTAHGLDLSRQLTSKDGEAAVRVFRDPEELATSYTLAISFGLETMRAVLNHYRPAELQNGSFARWYRGEVKPVLDQLAGVGTREME
jgi:hypothetical protein